MLKPLIYHFLSLCPQKKSIKLVEELQKTKAKLELERTAVVEHADVISASFYSERDSNNGGSLFSLGIIAQEIGFRKKLLAIYVKIHANPRQRSKNKLIYIALKILI